VVAKSSAGSPLPQAHVEWSDAMERTRIHRFGAEAEPPLTPLEQAILSRSRPGEGLRMTPMGPVPEIQNVALLNNKTLQAPYNRAQERLYLIEVQRIAASKWLKDQGVVSVLADGRRVVDQVMLDALIFQGNEAAPGPQALTDWMRAYAEAAKASGTPAKRDSALQDCMAKTHQTYRAARAAWEQLPADLKRAPRDTDSAIARRRVGSDRATGGQ